MIHLANQESFSRERLEALTYLLEYANEGRVEAMRTLGELYSDGKYFSKDYVLAWYWLENAAQNGCNQSGYRLFRMMLQTGTGTEQDFEKILHYLKTAQSINRIEIDFAIGYIYYKGLGGKQDYFEAIKYFERVAECHPRAMYMLGLCYRNGYGVRRNITAGNYHL